MRGRTKAQASMPAFVDPETRGALSGPSARARLAQARCFGW
jgi:hypothetical protein